jgi:hypothetical protein
MPPLLYVVAEDIGTHTEKDAVLADATNRMKELFCKPKHVPKPEPVQSCVVDPDVLPHKPLKSQTAVAVAQELVEGKVLEQEGSAGG